ncbi:MAG: phage tail protein, partial [Candidatus Electrothrix sp. AR3]|nr:phage tail protein [Candidatus Electrothrix sp. AR3]
MAQEYPLPRFHFQIDWGGAKISFTEVTGLVIEREKIEYRHSDSPDFSKIAMPGMMKNSNITMKRGQFAKDFDYNKWFKEVANDRAGTRRDVTIRLLNEQHAPA